MDLRFLYHRTKYFIINPGKAWEVVHREERPMKFVRGSFFLPLIILVTISAFLGSMFFINTTLKPMYSVLAAVNTFLFLYLGVYGSAFVVREIMRAMDLGHDFLVAFKLVAYSMAPIFLSLTVSRLFESLLFIIIASVVSMLIIFFLLQIILSKLSQTLYFSIFA